MFVLEDPGKRRTKTQRELQSFAVRSYAAYRGHKRRQKRKGTKGPEHQRLEGIITTKPTCRRTSHPGSSSGSSRTVSIRSSSRSDSYISEESSERERSESLSPITAITSSIRLSSDGETFQEGRSIQFFIERTSTEWSGWCDHYFWRVMVTQASTSHSCIRHGLVSLAAVHEALEIPDDAASRRQKLWALDQSRKALLDMSKQHDDLSLSSLLMSHILLLVLTLFLDEKLTFGAMRVLYDLEKRLRRQLIEAPNTVPNADRFAITNYLLPIVERQRAKHGQLTDPMFSLRITPASHFYVEKRPIVPDVFLSEEDARSTLDKILNWTTYHVKMEPLPPHTVPPKAELAMQQWMLALAAFQSARTQTPPNASSYSKRLRETCNIELLRTSAQVYFMLIKLMHCESETAFDGYLDTYRSIVRVYKLVSSYKLSNGQSGYSVGFEANLLTIAGSAAMRWCRDPTIRRELIKVLLESNGREAHEGAGVHGAVADRIREIEEEAARTYRFKAGLSTQIQSAQDIPEVARIRLNRVEFYMMNGLMAVKYLKYPYRETDVDVTYVLHPGCGAFQTWPIDMEHPQIDPDVITGRGYFAWREDRSSKPTYLVESPKFFFNISRV